MHVAEKKIDTTDSSVSQEAQVKPVRQSILIANAFRDINQYNLTRFTVNFNNSEAGFNHFKETKLLHGVLRDSGAYDIQQATKVAYEGLRLEGRSAANNLELVERVEEDVRLEEGVIHAPNEEALAEMVEEIKRTKEARKHAQASRDRSGDMSMDGAIDDHPYRIIKTFDPKNPGTQPEKVLTNKETSQSTARQETDKQKDDRYRVDGVHDIESKLHSEDVYGRKEPGSSFERVKNVEQSKTLEKVEKSLASRKEGALKRLGKLGLTKLAGTFEKMNRHPKATLALGLLFAGASVATGGALSAAALAFSSLSVSSNFYRENNSRLQKKMEGEGRVMSDVERRKMALRALVIGSLVAFTSVKVMQEIVSLVGEGYHAVAHAINGAQDSLQAVTQPGGVAVPPESSTVTHANQPVSPGVVQAPQVIPQEPSIIFENIPPNTEVVREVVQEVATNVREYPDYAAIAQARSDELVNIAKRAAHMP